MWFDLKSTEPIIRRIALTCYFLKFKFPVVTSENILNYALGLAKPMMYQIRIFTTITTPPVLLQSKFLSAVPWAWAFEINKLLIPFRGFL